MTDNVALRTDNLSKQFSSLKGVDDRNGYAVRDLNISVNPGDIYGFLGPNGSGKTTSIRMILGLVKPSSGTAFVFGKDVRKDRLKAVSLCGSMIDIPSFYPYLSARKNLQIFAGLSGGVEKKRIDETLELVGLLSRAKSKVRTFSHGMRQRLGFARAILLKPKLLLLDEPTNGLDPEGNWEIIQAIKRLSSEDGISIILSSHLLSEIEQLCNRSCILRRGRILFEGNVSELLSSRGIIEVQTDNNSLAMQKLQESDFTVRNLKVTNGKIIFENEEASVVNEFLVQNGFKVDYLAARKRTLREVFLAYMNKGSGDSENSPERKNYEL